MEKQESFSLVGFQLPPDRSVEELLPVVGESDKESSGKPSSSGEKRMSSSSSKSQKRIIVKVPGQDAVDEDGNVSRV